MRSQSIVAIGRLELEFCSELQIARIVVAGHSSKGTASEGCVDGIRTAVIERIERLKSKLQTNPLGKVEVLDRRDVPELIARP